jgi:hypothetical protein
MAAAALLRVHSCYTHVQLQFSSTHGSFAHSSESSGMLLHTATAAAKTYRMLSSICSCTLMIPHVAVRAAVAAAVVTRTSRGCSHSNGYQ